MKAVRSVHVEAESSVGSSSVVRLNKRANQKASVVPRWFVGWGSGQSVDALKREAWSQGNSAFASTGTPRNEELARLKRELARVKKERYFFARSGDVLYQ